jgi:hypothetical protein
MGIMERIVSHMDIDTRLAFKIPPRRLKNIPNIDFPKHRTLIHDHFAIKVSPFRLWVYFTAYTVVNGINYAFESEYCYETGRIVTRVTGGLTHHRIYQIVEFPDDDDDFPNEQLWCIHRQFENLREIGA